MIQFIKTSFDENLKVVADFRNNHVVRWSNYYGCAKEDDCDYLETADVFILRKKEADFYRLYCMTSCMDSLMTILKKLTDAEYVINIPSKQSIAECQQMLEGSGFYLIGEYVRFFNKDIEYANQFLSVLSTDGIDHSISISEIANISDILAVNSILNNTFSKYTDYLPSVEELNRMIREKRVYVNRNRGNIIGVIIFTPTGKNYYLNAWVGDSEYGAFLLKRVYELLITNSASCVNFWVRKDNKPVLKIHKALGATPTGLTDYTFINKKI